MSPARALLLAGTFMTTTGVQAADRVPGAHWMRYAHVEDAGYDAARLAEAHAFAVRVGSTAVMVIQRGAVVVDWGQTARRFRSHSARKSLMSALYGVHIELSTIDPTQTLAELGVDDCVHPLTNVEKTATIHDLLAARSGIYVTAAYEPASNPKPERGAFLPGEHFCYNNWDFNALATIFERETGTRIFEEFDRRVAAPIGMQDYHPSHGYYHFDLEMSEHPAYPFRMSARDFARFGLLYLNDGRWGDRQILSESYVEESRSHISDSAWNGGYGLMWWVHDEEPFKSLGMFSAYGNYCQTIDVLPGADMVFVNRVDSYTDSVITMTWEQHKRLLRMILAARTGAAIDDPTLVPVQDPPPRYDTIALSPADRATYIGTYPPIYDTPVRVFDGGDGLRIDFGEGDVPLDCVGPNHFVERDFEEHIHFEPDGNGAWTMISMWGLIMRASQALAGGDLGDADDRIDRLQQWYPECESGHRLRCELRMQQAGAALGDAIAEFDAIARQRPQFQLDVSPVAWDLAGAWSRVSPMDPPRFYLERFVGSYGVRRITLEDGELFYVRGDRPPVRLVPMAWNLFAYERSENIRIRFHDDADGRVTHLDIVERDAVISSSERDDSPEAADSAGNPVVTPR